MSGISLVSRVALLAIVALQLIGWTNGRLVNDEALSLIKTFEGFFPNFYIDPVGIRTIGYGHACHVNDCNNLRAVDSSGKERTVRAPLSERDATDLLRRDLGKFGKCVLDATTVSLNDNQYGALVSFAFNVGCGGFSGSTLRTSVNNNAGATTIRENFMRWVRGGGRVLPGLVRRRTAEADLFLKSGGSGSNGAGQSCTDPSSGERGICSTTCTGGTFISGLCPGDSSIRCCIGQTCSANGQTGKCRDEDDCQGNSLSGACPGDASFKCCVGTPVLNFPCPSGATFNPTLGFCRDSLSFYGPFTNAMTNECVTRGGGQVSCRREVDVTINGVTAKVQRWSSSFESVRGTAQCPLGTTSSSNYMGHCIETVNGKVNVFGPFAKSLVDSCRAAGGGSACFTIRWSGAFFRSIAIGASYQPFNVTEEGDSLVELFPQELIDEQIELSKETIVPDESSSSFVAPLFLLFLSFVSLTLIL